MTGNPQLSLILDLVEAFRRSKTMFTAVRLGIFDELAAGPRTLAQLAAKLHLHAAALERLLNGCRGLGLLLLENGQYRNAPEAARYLVSARADSLAGYIAYSDQSLYKLWDHLDDAVREGTNRWTQSFGERRTLFDFYFRDPAATRNFLAGMHAFGQIASDLVVRAFDLSRYRHIVDLGGATGHLAIAACTAYPAIRATVLDLPAVEPFARETISQSAVAGRISFVAADFFKDALPPADIYCLGRILHDWQEPKIHMLLSKIAAALPANGALLIAEKLLYSDRSGPVAGLMQDLNMLVCTDGMERTEAEFASLLRAARFATVDFRRTGSIVDVILGSKGQ